MTDREDDMRKALDEMVKLNKGPIWAVGNSPAEKNRIDRERRPTSWRRKLAIATDEGRL